MPPTTKRKAYKKKLQPGFNQSPAHQSQRRFLQATVVYLMHNIPFFWLNKFGITDKLGNRVRNVSETTPGYVFNVIAPRLEFGWHLEQFVHSVYRYQNVHFWTGSGRTEWFVILSPIVGSLVLFGLPCIGVHPGWKVCALAYFTPFVWMDGLFWLIVFSFARIVFYGVVILAGAYLIAHAN